MTLYDPTLPAGNQIGFSYEYGVDINLAHGDPDATEPQWQSIRLITAVDPKVESVMQSVQTYDDKGASNETKVSENATISFTIQERRTNTGKLLPEADKIRSTLQSPDLTGEAATVHLRWYHKPAQGTPDPDEAYEAICTGSVERGETGNDGIGSLNVSASVKGLRKQITNPFTGWVIEGTAPVEPAPAAG